MNNQTLLEELAEIDLALTEGDATPEQEARGQYIVTLADAAPDLLKAAKAVIGKWECGDLARAVRSLSSAIAKAEGR